VTAGTTTAAAAGGSGAAPGVQLGSSGIICLGMLLAAVGGAMLVM